MIKKHLNIIVVMIHCTLITSSNFCMNLKSIMEKQVSDKISQKPPQIVFNRVILKELDPNSNPIEQCKRKEVKTITRQPTQIKENYAFRDYFLKQLYDQTNDLSYRVRIEEHASGKKYYILPKDLLALFEKNKELEKATSGLLFIDKFVTDESWALSCWTDIKNKQLFWKDFQGIDVTFNVLIEILTKTMAINDLPDNKFRNALSYDAYLNAIFLATDHFHDIEQMLEKRKNIEDSLKRTREEKYDEKLMGNTIKKTKIENSESLSDYDFSETDSSDDEFNTPTQEEIKYDTLVQQKISAIVNELKQNSNFVGFSPQELEEIAYSKLIQKMDELKKNNQTK